MTGGLPGTALHTAVKLHAATSGGSGRGAPVTTRRLPAREAARHELSKPLYHQDDPSPLQRLLNWFWHWFSSLLDHTIQATPGGWFGLLTIAVVVLLLLIVLRLRLGKLRQEPAAPDSTLFGTRPRTAAEHRAAAEKSASESRWSEALQERVRALVRALEERALLDHRPGRTADEAALEAGRSLPAHAEALTAAARAFDEVMYAERPADAEAYGRIRDLDTALQHTRPRLPEQEDTLAGLPQAIPESRLNAPSVGGSR